MPYYGEKETIGGEKLSRSLRRRLAKERALLEKVEDHCLSTGPQSKIREQLLYPSIGLITASSTLWLHHSFEELSWKGAQTYLIPLTTLVCIVLSTLYEDYENYLRPPLARLREPAVAIELSRVEKKYNRKARLDRLHTLKEEVAGKEAAFYSVSIINTFFLTHVTLAYSFCLKSVPPNYSYVVSIILAMLGTVMVSKYFKPKKKCNRTKKNNNLLEW